MRITNKTKVWSVPLSLSLLLAIVVALGRLPAQRSSVAGMEAWLGKAEAALQGPEAAEALTRFGDDELTLALEWRDALRAGGKGGPNLARLQRVLPALYLARFLKSPGYATFGR